MIPPAGHRARRFLPARDAGADSGHGPRVRAGTPGAGRAAQPRGRLRAHPQRFWNTHGVDRWLPVFTAMFLHGGWWHLIANQWALWLFGDNVEDALGHGRFMGFYLACGAAAAVVHVHGESRLDRPVRWGERSHRGCAGRVSRVLPSGAGHHAGADPVDPLGRGTSRRPLSGRLVSLPVAQQSPPGSPTSPVPALGAVHS